MKWRDVVVLRTKNISEQINNNTLQYSEDFSIRKRCDRTFPYLKCAVIFSTGRHKYFMLGMGILQIQYRIQFTQQSYSLPSWLYTEREKRVEKSYPRKSASSFCPPPGKMLFFSPFKKETFKCNSGRKGVGLKKILRDNGKKEIFTSVRMLCRSNVV